MHQFSGANLDPHNDLPNFKQPSLPNLLQNPLGVCTKMGFFNSEAMLAKKITRTAQQNLGPSGQMVEICWVEAFAVHSKPNSAQQLLFTTESSQNPHPAQQIFGAEST